MSPLNADNHELLKRVYNANTPEESRTAYDEWASRYDADLAEQNYLAPVLIARAVLSRFSQIKGPILDAGCGTGLLGIALRHQLVEANRAQAETQFEIDGIDLSPGMLNVAETTGCYRNLSAADLTQPLALSDAAYGAVTCVGTLTHGHVGPIPALREFVRVVKASGIVAVTVLEQVWETGGYAGEIEKLRMDDLVEEPVQSEKAQIGERDGTGVYARIVVMTKK